MTLKFNKSSDDDFAVLRADFHHVASAVELFGGDEGRAGAAEAVEDYLSFCRVVGDAWAHDFDGFGGRVFSEVWAWAFPDCRLVAVSVEWGAVALLPAVQAEFVPPVVVAAA